MAGNPVPCCIRVKRVAINVDAVDLYLISPFFFGSYKAKGITSLKRKDQTSKQLLSSYSNPARTEVIAGSRGT